MKSFAGNAIKNGSRELKTKRVSQLWHPFLTKIDYRDVNYFAYIPVLLQSVPRLLTLSCTSLFHPSFYIACIDYH